MLRRALVTGLAVLSLTGSTVLAEAAVGHSSDERMAAVGHSPDERMTVLRVDAAGSRFLCAEHQRWVWVEKGDLDGVGPGDIVRVDWTGGRLARLQLLRTATDEMSSPE